MNAAALGGCGTCQPWALCDHWEASQPASIPQQMDLLKINRQLFSSSRFKIARPSSPPVLRSLLHFSARLFPAGGRVLGLPVGGPRGGTCLPRECEAVRPVVLNAARTFRGSG